MNKVTIFGRLGKDPEIRTTQSGVTVAKFSVATKEKVKKGERWEDHTEWHSCVAFGKTAELIRDYFNQGSSILIEGYLRTSSWEKDGHKNYRTEVNVGQIFFTESKRYDDNSNRTTKSKQAPQPSVDDNDIPF